jgi:hypothetical protein
MSTLRIWIVPEPGECPPSDSQREFRLWTAESRPPDQQIAGQCASEASRPRRASRARRRSFALATDFAVPRQLSSHALTVCREEQRASECGRPSPRPATRVTRTGSRAPRSSLRSQAGRPHIPQLGRWRRSAPFVRMRRSKTWCIMSAGNEVHSTSSFSGRSSGYSAAAVDILDRLAGRGRVRRRMPPPRRSALVIEAKLTFTARYSNALRSLRAAGRHPSASSHLPRRSRQQIRTRRTRNP